MTATIHPHPRNRRPATGAGYPAAFGSAAGHGFHWGAPAAPMRAAPVVPLLDRLDDRGEGLSRRVRRTAG